MSALPPSIARFIRSVRGKPQTEILKQFVRSVIFANNLAKEGSIHIFNKDTQLLEIFNPEDFFFKESLLNQNKRLFNLMPGKGGAGAAFNERQPKLIDPKTDTNFILEGGGGDISSMICVPIYSEKDVPIGVASFHNPPGVPPLTREHLDVISSYVDVLSVALCASPKKFDLEHPKTVFVVHGHDRLALVELELICQKLHIKPYILQNEPPFGLSIIEILEQKIGADPAISFGIVLMTADDMVFTDRGSGKTIFRARQNVLLEAGMLFAPVGRSRVALLAKADIDVPSDLGGILYLPFEKSVKETVSKLVPHLRNAGFSITEAQEIEAGR